jgi:hypothetical protein
MKEFSRKYSYPGRLETMFRPGYRTGPVIMVLDTLPYMVLDMSPYIYFVMGSAHDAHTVLCHGIYISFPIGNQPSVTTQLTTSLLGMREGGVHLPLPRPSPTVPRPSIV